MMPFRNADAVQKYSTSLVPKNYTVVQDQLPSYQGAAIHLPESPRKKLQRHRCSVNTRPYSTRETTVHPRTLES